MSFDSNLFQSFHSVLDSGDLVSEKVGVIDQISNHLMFRDSKARCMQKNCPVRFSREYDMPKSPSYVQSEK